MKKIIVQKCPTCLGKGYLVNKRTSTSMVFFDRSTRDCTNCKGTGEIEVEVIDRSLPEDNVH